MTYELCPGTGYRTIPFESGGLCRVCGWAVGGRNVAVRHKRRDPRPGWDPRDPPLDENGRLIIPPATDGGPSR